MQRFDMSRAELEQYRPDVACPDDFDDFWAATLRENPFDPSSITRTPVDTGLLTVNVWDVVFGGYAGDPIHAWLLMPADARGPLPGIVEFVGYNGSRGLPAEHLQWASAGFAHLVMDVRGQGAGWGGNGGSTADPHGSGPAVGGFMTRGIDAPHSYYYRRLFTDAHHAVEALATCPGVDSTRIATAGGSQGGGLTIAATALNHRVFAAMPDVPFLCHFQRAVGMTGQEPYEEICRYLSIMRDKVDTVFTTLSYFDGVNLARRVTPGTPALFSTGEMDMTCPPSTVFAARNWWARPNSTDEHEAPEIIVYRFNQHEGGQMVQWGRQLTWLRTLLADSSSN